MQIDHSLTSPTTVILRSPSSSSSSGVVVPPSSSSSAASNTATTTGTTTLTTPPAITPTVSAPTHKLPKPGGNAAVEIEAYLHVLILSLLQSIKEILLLRESATQFLEFLSNYNHRTLDFFQGKGWSYLVWSYSSNVTSSSSSTNSSSSSSSSSTASNSTSATTTSVTDSSLGSLQPALMTAYRTACLHHDEYGQSVLINLLLYIYIQQKDFETAASLVDRVVFPEAISSSQNVRFLYYTGRIHAVQLRYSDAHNALMQALRKSPPVAVGFRTLVQKFAIIVQMLMGEIPERSIFSQKEMKASLVPYLSITRAVRSGDVRTFTKVLGESTAVFTKDGTLSLIRRLESNVIRTGLRKIVSSYSRISFSAIATKLGLSSAEDAEYLAAKAIRDGVLDGVLNHEQSYLESVSAMNVYTSKEPQEAFHRRITFCIDVHDEAVRAMRYPPNVTRADLESAEARRERERGEAELINDLEEGKDDFDDEFE